MSRTLLLASLVALTAAMPAVAADVAGDWKIDGSIGQMPVSIVCTLKEADNKLTGVCRNQEVGDLPLTGETSGDTATWTYDVSYQGQQFTVSYNGTLKSATDMDGSISVAGNPSGSFTGKKQ